MGFVSRVLPSLQRLSEGEMPDTVTIHRATGYTANAGGAMVPNGTSDTQTVGRLSSVSSTAEQYLEGVRGGEQTQLGLGQVTLPLDTEILLTDTLTVVVARTGTSHELTVEEVVPATTFSVHRKAVVKAK